MADIASSDVTYTQTSKSIGESGYRTFNFTLAFGNSTLTYPSGGVPLVAGNLGCPNQIRSFVISDPGSANGNVYKYDITNNKIRIYRGAGFTPAGTVAAPTFTGSPLGTHTHTIPSGTDGAGGTSGATSGGTPAGTNSAPVFTGTAVVAGALIEFVAATTAPAATTLYVTVTGW